MKPWWGHLNREDVLRLWWWPWYLRNRHDKRQLATIDRSPRNMFEEEPATPKYLNNNIVYNHGRLLTEFLAK